MSQPTHIIIYSVVAAAVIHSLRPLILAFTKVGRVIKFPILAARAVMRAQKMTAKFHTAVGQDTLSLSSARRLTLSERSHRAWVRRAILLLESCVC